MVIARTLIAAAALLASTTAQAQCLTNADAEAMTLVAMPDILTETARVCAARLSAGSPLRQPDGALIARYRVEADRAWPAAKGAIVKLSDPSMDMLLQSDFARPMLTSLIAPLITGRIAAEDCGTVDRMVTLLAPLPARNTAALVVTTLQYLKAEKAKGRAVAVPDLPLCQDRR